MKCHGVAASETISNRTAWLPSTSETQSPRSKKQDRSVFDEFVHGESAGGIVLFAFTALALAWANSPWSDSYFALWRSTISIGFGESAITMTIHHWINDGLMVVFFLLVGLEIKREFRVGELASRRLAALPIAAAIGGMVLPAALYFALNAGTEGSRGWAIPMATDIAFALGVIALLGARAPAGLKVFVAALAIVDDIGAILVIALFYTASISQTAVAAAIGTALVLFGCKKAGVRNPVPYAVLGVVLWLAFLSSGIHATVAGVLLALLIPATTRIDEDEFLLDARESLMEFQGASSPTARSVLSNTGQQEALRLLEVAVDKVQSPLLKMEHSLHGPVSFVILPLFVLANAGVQLNSAMFSTLSWRVVVGIMLGLIVGKVIGVTGASLAAVRVGWASLPATVRGRDIFGASWVTGIGFTMSLFIANLAFGEGPLLDSAKIAVIFASLIAGVAGWFFLHKSAASSPVGDSADANGPGAGLT